MKNIKNIIRAKDFNETNESYQKEVQKWWKPRFGDLYSMKNDTFIEDVVIQVYGNENDENYEQQIEGVENNLKSKINLRSEIIPLLSVSQLIDLVEDITKEHLMSSSTAFSPGYLFKLFKLREDIPITGNYIEKENLLEALFEFSQLIINKRGNMNNGGNNYEYNY